MLIYQRVIVIPTCQRVALIQETMEPMPFPIQYQLFPYSSTIPFITLLGAGRYSDSLREICDEFFMTWFVHPVSLIIQPINWLVQFPLYLSICQSPAHCAHTYIILYTYIYAHMMHTHTCIWLYTATVSLSIADIAIEVQRQAEGEQVARSNEGMHQYTRETVDLRN
jgi:hypothetical protein